MQKIQAILIAYKYILVSKSKNHCLSHIFLINIDIKKSEAVTDFTLFCICTKC